MDRLNKDAPDGLSREEAQSIASEMRPSMEVRAYLKKAVSELNRGGSDIASAMLRVKLVADAYHSDRNNEVPFVPTNNAHVSASVRQTMTTCFFSQALFFEAFGRLSKLGEVDNRLREAVREIAVDILKPAERDANNRSFLYGLGHAWASISFAEAPEARIWRAYAEAVWYDFYGPGDCYEPGYVAHNIAQAIELGLLLGKNEELRSDKLRRSFRRYRDQISPTGLAIQPGDGGYQNDYVEALTLMAKVTRDGTFLSAARRAFAAGSYTRYGRYEGNGLCSGARIDERALPEALEKRFAELAGLGIEAVEPEVGSHIQSLYPGTYRIPDRLIMQDNRASAKPYAAFCLNDRMETLHHAHEDNRGELYHYEADGVMYLSRVGWHKWAGQTNTFIAADASSEFPYGYTKGLLRNHWYKGSANLRLLRDFFESDRYRRTAEVNAAFAHAGLQGDLVPRPHFFTDQNSPYGVFLSNPEAMAGQCDSVTIDSVTLSFHCFPGKDKEAAAFPAAATWTRDSREVAPCDGPIELLVEDIHVAGTKGKERLVEIDACLDAIRVDYYEAGKPGTALVRRQLTESEKREILALAVDEETGRRALRVKARPGRTDVHFPGIHKRVNLDKEYQRIGFSYKYLTDARAFLRTPIKVLVNEVTCRSLHVDHQQGGKLAGANVEAANNDQYGEMRYEGVYTHDSHWSRRSILTEEGYLLVVDTFWPGEEADGMAAGPVWQTSMPIRQGLHWYDSVADAHLQKNLLVYYHPQPGHEYGVQWQPKLWNTQEYAVYDKAILEAGRAEVYVSVLIPHDGAIDGQMISGKAHAHGRIVSPGEETSGIHVAIGENREVSILLQPTDQWRVRRMEVRFDADDRWRVVRHPVSSASR